MKLKKMTLMLALAGYATVAGAAFEVIDTGEARAPEVRQAINQPVPQGQLVARGDVITSGVTHTGRKPAIIQPARGFGKDVSVKDALFQIVPSNFQVFNDTQVSLARHVSWSAADGEDWSMVMDSVLRNAGLAATLDWSLHTISLEKGRGVAVPEGMKSVPLWRLTLADKTVRGALLRWAKDAGWRVDWDVAVDFPARIETSYDGDFETAVGELMKSLSGSDFPLQACSYENNTIRIVRYGETGRCEGKK